MNNSISCYLITKNVLTQGYPFIEAIASNLPVCDEFIILDGHSNDGTYEILEKISNLNKKIKLKKIQWNSNNFKDFIRIPSLYAKKQANGQYIFQIQANEILPDENVQFIKELPEIYPHAISFSFPYFQFLREYLLTWEFRIRFGKNVDYLVPIKDAWTLGVDSKFVIKYILKNTINLKEIGKILFDGITYEFTNYAASPYSKCIYLSKPIMRYYSITRLGLINKLKTHTSLLKYSNNYQSKLFSTISEKLNDVSNSSDFWEIAIKLLREFNFNVNKNGPRKLPFDSLSLEYHPPIMRELLKKDLPTYFVRDEILDRIRNS